MPSRCSALELIPGWAEEFRAAFGRDTGGLLHGYRTEDADTIVVALGSVLGTIKDTVDEMRADGDEDRRARHHLLPALPAGRGARRAAGAKRVVVLEKSLAVGLGGIVSTNVRTPRGQSGCGAHGDRRPGRPLHHARLARARVRARPIAGTLEPLTFLDLDRKLVERALAREREQRRSGPIAENMLRDIGVVAARSG